MTNLEKSELVVSRILSILLDRGLSGEDLTFDETQLDDEFLPFFYPCLDWLRREGLIHAHSILQMDGSDGDTWVLAESITISAKGFSLLNQTFTPRSEEPDQSSTVHEAVKNVSAQSTSLYQIGDLVGGVLGGFTKSIGS